VEKEDFRSTFVNDRLLLVVDDDDAWRDLTAERLREKGYEVLGAASGSEAIRMAADCSPALVLLDWQLPDQNGGDVLKQIKRLRIGGEVIMLTAFASPKLAVQAIKDGAFDFVAKEADPDELLVTVRCALEARAQRERAVSLSAEQYRGLILGNSPQIRLVHERIHQAAGAGAPVLITGETGTGKELVARAIVAGSERRSHQFVTVDCTTLARDLVESELFGHERGAFTGAQQRKRGRVELADQGTLFLDEIGELELSLQAKLLRVLERKEFFRVGGVAPVTVDVRVIAATNRNLHEEVRAGRFRRDLFYRLNVVHLHLQPLRERPEDIPLLAEHFLNRFARELRKPIHGFSEDVMECFLQYQWPGNVRELENTIQRMVIFAHGSSITTAVLPQEITSIRFANASSPYSEEHNRLATDSVSLEEATRRFRRWYVQRALLAHGAKAEGAAQALKVNRTHFYKLLKSLGLRLEAAESPPSD
jgi:DNA-binding NtrC family response regulator